MNTKQIVNKYVYLTFLENLDTPEEAFKMVMEYATRTGKNPWECMGLAFSSYTVIIRDMEDDSYIGYVSGHVISKDKELFLDHGYMRHPVFKPEQMFDAICLMIKNKSNLILDNIILQSDLDSSLWCKKYGMKKSKEIIYTKSFIE